MLPNKPTTFIDELVAAGRGLAAIVTGDRRSASYFDFSLRGLAGSFVAILVATAFSAYVPIVTGGGNASRLPTGGWVLLELFLLAVQIGFSALVLRQLNRMDGLVPYLVAHNWANFFLSVVSTLLNIFGLTSDFVVLIIGVLMIAIEINIARLIVTLNPWQIAMFLIAQIVGVICGLILLILFVPLPADMLTPITGG
ncbi:MAG TPA: hypothetical protein VL418_04440 [Devosiaceae bacterium]|nr:hypothetical protein [Devosiaceae bacterium]